MSDTNENGPRLTSRPVGAVSEETSLLHAEKYTLTQGDQEGGAAVSDREAMKLALDFVTSKQWGTRPYMEDGVFTDAFVLAEALRTHLAAQTYELDPSIRLNGLEIALANCEKSHELTAKKYMDTFDENERLKEQMKKWMKAGGDNDTTR